ncbi:hypothetical protein L484_003412 [Morus notabilis]|uniref:Uncharacterized protein n=1 Tax=Morus notabilis TaxID=981085 RepID=W9S1F5_9ROSA|nr:hypothetical protein L484_003412 [Morus notabilis]
MAEEKLLSVEARSASVRESQWEIGDGAKPRPNPTVCALTTLFGTLSISAPNHHYSTTPHSVDLCRLPLIVLPSTQPRPNPTVCASTTLFGTPSISAPDHHYPTLCRSLALATHRSPLAARRCRRRPFVIAKQIAMLSFEDQRWFVS